MTNEKFKSDYFVFIIGLILLISSKLIIKNTKRPIINLSQQESALNFDADLLKITSFGNKKFLSSLMWIETMLESDLEHYKEKDLNSWMYLRFHTITELDPLFYQTYLFGGMYLSIVKDDVVGAEKIYKKGLKFFPHDFELNLNIAFNYLFELNNNEKAIYHYKRLLDYPDKVKRRIPYLESLLTKLMVRENKLEIALSYAKNAMLKTPKDSHLFYKFKRLYQNIKTELDLNCLNSHSKNDCNQKDYNNKPYLYKNGIYRSSSPWEKVK